MTALPPEVEPEFPSPDVTITTPSQHIRSCVVVDRNLSAAWTRAFATVASPGGKALAPLVVSVTGFDNGVPDESVGVRNLLDEALGEYAREEGRADRPARRVLDPLTCQGVANTIFPGSMWSPGTDRE